MSVPRAVIRLSFRREELAKAIYEAVEPDNKLLPKGLEIRSSIEGRTLSFEVYCDKGLGSLWSTLDDLLACIQTAERVLKALLED